MIPVPQPILASLARTYGAAADTLSHFSGGREDSDGVIYAYPHAGRRRLLKIMALAAAGQRRGVFYLEERLRFMKFLGEHDAPIVYPQLSPQGSLFETVASDTHLWVGYAMEIAPGRPVPAKTWDPAFFARWGETIGRLHRLAREYPSWKAALDPDTGEELLTWREECRGFREWTQDADAKSGWAEMERQLDALPVTRDAFGFIHNDPHIWNLLYDGERLTLLDFDVANHHWFINDLAIACQSILFEQTGGMDRPVYDHAKLRAFVSHLLEGYARTHHLADVWLNRLDLFITYRRLLLFTVMQGWISSKPEWRASWKRMIQTRPPVVGTF